jgi:GNAT superfamily N-acetyltransferase
MYFRSHEFIEENDNRYERYNVAARQQGAQQDVVMDRLRPGSIRSVSAVGEPCGCVATRALLWAILKSMKYSTRLLLPADEPIFREILSQALCAHFTAQGQAAPEPDILDEPDYVKWIGDWARPHDAGVLAQDEHQQVIGVAWFRLFSKEENPDAYVDENTPQLAIVVLPEHRGKGVGKLLISSLLQVARSSYCALSLDVYKGHATALRLYERSGFETVATRDNSLIMRCEL